jgi:hypothetical protein
VIYCAETCFDKFIPHWKIYSAIFFWNSSGNTVSLL